MDSHTLEILNTHIKDINIPVLCNKVYKDECMYSFDTPFNETGLYVCLKTFYGLGKEHLERHHRKTGSCVFLHLKYEKIALETEESDLSETKKITRLAINVQGGFDADPLSKKYETKKSYSLVILPHLVIIPWPNDELPEKVVNSINGIICAESAHKLIELEAAAWDGELRAVTKHTDLFQINNNKKIPPSGWKCERCELTSNLWLNLTDGSILCGRKFYDGTGGNEHALQHFRETGYPLAVKLGTISKEGKGDVFSYDEDEMVEDPSLINHLAHFGINIANMVKSDKSMVELELDFNQKYGEWAAIQEAGSNLQPLYGPGYTGLMNLGNSCYLNSTMQVLFTVPSFITKFVDEASTIFDNVQGNPAEDFNTQMAKLGTGLLSGKYSKPPINEADNSFSVSPNMFKSVVGKGHPLFCTKNQQDAQEFLLHILFLVQKNGRHQIDPTESFKFKIEERFQCSSSLKVQYFYRTDYCLPLTIPVEAAINREELTSLVTNTQSSNIENREEPLKSVRPRVRFESCLEAFIQKETVEQFYSSAIKNKTVAYKTTRLSTFPRYLFIHLKKYKLLEDWSIMKLDVSVEIPNIINLSLLKGNGLQSGEEELLPSEDESRITTQINQHYLNQLVDMGFPEEACKRALHITKNQSVEDAANWIMENINDPSIMEPFCESKMTGTESPHVDESALASLMNLGFSKNHCIKALQKTGNNVERAADWVFSHVEEIDETEIMEETSVSKENQMNEESLNDDAQKSQYRLKAFISHMGPSTAVGHYVCHILRDNKWVIYNDEKVALSENPPKDLGYVYLFERL